jgi:hypothetical protein
MNSMVNSSAGLSFAPTEPFDGGFIISIVPHAAGTVVGTASPCLSLMFRNMIRMCWSFLHVKGSAVWADKCGRNRCRRRKLDHRIQSRGNGSCDGDCADLTSADCSGA